VLIGLADSRCVTLASQEQFQHVNEAPLKGQKGLWGLPWRPAWSWAELSLGAP